MHITHSRAVIAAVVALSTCAGATRMAARPPEPPPERVALLGEAPPPDSATIAPGTPGAPH